jgi:secreted Zn-dependent insulinase-like peptidase
LAGNTELTGNFVENSCKLHRTGMLLLSETDVYSRFSGGNKQTNKQIEHYFIVSVQMACLTVQLLYVKE